MSLNTILCRQAGVAYVPESLPPRRRGQVISKAGWFYIACASAIAAGAVLAWVL
jgi:hypothetical protein